MATVILSCVPRASAVPSTVFFSDDHVSAVGDADLGACMSAAGDGKYAHAQANTGDDPTQVIPGFCFLDPTNQIPADATITSVQVSIVLRGPNLSLNFAESGRGMQAFLPTTLDVGPMSWGSLAFVPDPAPLVAVGSFTTFSTAPLLTRPDVLVVDPFETGYVPWTRAAIVTDPATGIPSWGLIAEFPFTGTPTFLDIDHVYLTVILAGDQWCYNPTSNHYVRAAECPGPPFISGVAAPTITISGVSPRST